MPEVPQLQQKYAAASSRKGHRRKIETDQRLERAFAAEGDKPLHAERVHPARQGFAPSAARRRGAAWKDRLHAGEDPHLLRDSPSRKCPRILPRKKDRPKRMNHKKDRRVRLTAIQRHTASMFLSPVSFALRTLPLRAGGNALTIACT